MIICEEKFNKSAEVGRKLVCNQTLIFDDVWFPPMTPLVIHEIKRSDVMIMKEYEIIYMIVAPEGWTEESKFYLGKRYAEGFKLGIVKE